MRSCEELRGCITSHHHAGADEEAVWLPQTGLPNALRTEDVEASLGTEAAEPGLNKQVQRQLATCRQDRISGNAT